MFANRPLEWLYVQTREHRSTSWSKEFLDSRECLYSNTSWALLSWCVVCVSRRRGCPHCTLYSQQENKERERINLSCHVPQRGKTHWNTHSCPLTAGKLSVSASSESLVFCFWYRKLCCIMLHFKQKPTFVYAPIRQLRKKQIVT